MTINLNDNQFNRDQRPDAPKFKLWRNVGLMLTYRCPARCACCYVFSGPDAYSPEMSTEMALSCWRGVRRLAGDAGQVHLTGGEPFICYSRLCEILRQAQRENLGGLQKIETNAYWCTDAGLVRERMAELKEIGLTKLQISTDVYHQQYIPIENVRMAAEIATEVLGEKRVQIRWRDFFNNPHKVVDLPPNEQAQSFRDAFVQHPERMLGRAAVELVSLLPPKDYDEIADSVCSWGLLGAGHVHIDGSGHIFIGTCIGIIAGDIASGSIVQLDQFWRDFDIRRHPVLSILAERGPAGLVEVAREADFMPNRTYASKCHLCFEVRRFLYQKKRYNDLLGPAICYGLS